MSLDNKCLFDGRLAADPKFWDNDDPKKRRVRFPLAVQRKGVDKAKNPEAKDVDYFPIIAWGNQSAAIAQYCKKGKRVKVEGELRQNIYERDGETIYELEVVAAPYGVEFKEDAKKNQAPEQTVSQEDLVAAVLAKLQTDKSTEAPTTNDECPIP